MRTAIFIFVLMASAGISFAQGTPKKVDLLIGRWELCTYNYMVDGKMVHVTGGGRSYIHEFRQDGTFRMEDYANDSLVQVITGNWKLSDRDTLSYFNLTSESVPNLGPISIPEKLVSVTAKELVVSNGIFVVRGNGPAPKEDPGTWYRRVE